MRQRPPGREPEAHSSTKSGQPPWRLGRGVDSRVDVSCSHAVTVTVTIESEGHHAVLEGSKLGADVGAVSKCVDARQPESSRQLGCGKPYPGSGGRAKEGRRTNDPDHSDDRERDQQLHKRETELAAATAGKRDFDPLSGPDQPRNGSPAEQASPPLGRGMGWL